MLSFAELLASRTQPKDRPPLRGIQSSPLSPKKPRTPSYQTNNASPVIVGPEPTLEEPPEDDEEEEEDEDSFQARHGGMVDLVKANKLHVATEVTGDCCPHLRYQGDMAFYTPMKLEERQALRSNAAVLGALQEMWDLLPKKLRFLIDKPIYFQVYMKLYQEFVPSQSSSQIMAALQQDWEQDRKGSHVLSMEAFFDSMFALTDLWCPTVSAEDYVAFVHRCISVLQRGNLGTILPLKAAVKKQQQHPQSLLQKLQFDSRVNYHTIFDDEELTRDEGEDFEEDEEDEEEDDDGSYGLSTSSESVICRIHRPPHQPRHSLPKVHEILSIPHGPPPSAPPPRSCFATALKPASARLQEVKAAHRSTPTTPPPGPHPNPKGLSFAELDVPTRTTSTPVNSSSHQRQPDGAEHSSRGSPPSSLGFETRVLPPKASPARRATAPSVPAKFTGPIEPRKAPAMPMSSLVFGASDRLTPAHSNLSHVAGAMQLEGITDLRHAPSRSPRDNNHRGNATPTSDTTHNALDPKVNGAGSLRLPVSRLSPGGVRTGRSNSTFC